MKNESFYINNRMSMTMESYINQIDTFAQFEKAFPEQLLDDDARVGNYLDSLFIKYDKKYSAVSLDAGYGQAYAGNIVRGITKDPRRDALIAICLTIGTTVEELQYLLKYAGHAPLYVRRKRDVIIWFGFMKHKSVREVDDILYDKGYDLLSSKKI